MDPRKRQIAERFAAMPAGRQREFLDALRHQSLDFSHLPIVPAVTARSALSYAQARQWFLWQLEPESAAYHITGALTLRGRLGVAALQESFQALLARHESLRTVFRPNGEGVVEQVVQVVKEGIAFEVPVIESHDADAVRREVQRITDTPFNLTTGPLLRVALLRTSADEHVLIVVMHHIVSDGGSMQVIVNEFAAQYWARVKGEVPSMEALPIQYADYAAWQRNWLEAGEKDRQLAYWKAQLGTANPVLQLTSDRPRNADGNYRAARLSVQLQPSLAQALNTRAQAQGATLFMVLLSAFQAVLHRHAGMDDIRVGVPNANRHRAETEGVVGFFVNTQVLRARIDARMTLAELLNQSRDAALGAQEHQDLPFEQLVEALQPERSLGVSPLFQVMFNHQKDDHRALAQLPGLVVEGFELAEQSAQFELTMDAIEQPDGRIELTLTYAAELFEAATIERLALHYEAMLDALASHPEQAVGDVALLSRQERQQLQEWGTNPTRHAGDVPVHRLIERQARQTPKATALVLGDVELSYAELNLQANRLAHRLIAHGVGAEVRVGLAVERSIDMVVGLLAILKAGGAYVPLDPGYPAERLAYMLRDSGVSLLLTQRHVRPHLPDSHATVLELDTLELNEQPPHDPEVALHGQNLAYVIYTSGSTGRPKGIGISHAALAEHSQIAIGYFGLTPADRMLQFSTINFDGFVEQLFPPLVAGAAVVLRGPALWDSDTFQRELLNQRISIADLPTAYWHLLAQDFARSKPNDYGALRQVQATGEAMPPEGVRAWREAGLGHVKLLNTYGPTETVVTAIVQDCSAYLAGEEELPLQMPIGRPLAAREALVLDGQLKLAPQGVPGELYIGGELLARGYTGRPGLSAERFIADPFMTGQRLYRTGDIARWNAKGQLEYLGRVDHQVKVRGFRIELGEIEAQLLEQPGVREALVVAQPGPGGNRLMGYVSGDALDAEQLKEALTQAMPDYMVPSAIVVLNALPLNANGKLDRHALPQPQMDNDSGYEAPQGAIEETLAAVWAEVLGVQRVGRNDNFFALGGHSLLALQLLERMRQSGHPSTVRTLFQHPQLAAFAQALAASRGEAKRPLVVPANGIPQACTAIQPHMLSLVELAADHIQRIVAAVPGGAANIQDIYPLAPLQEGILFHHLLQTEGDSYITPCLLSFDTEALLQRFVASVDKAIARHDILRTAVMWEGLPAPVQVVCRHAKLELQWLAEGEADAAERLRAHVHPGRYRIDVRRAPMVQAVALHDSAQGRWLMQLPSHHLALDHVTQFLLVEEVALIQQGRDAELPEPVPFRDFVAQARSGVSPEEHEAFFTRMLGDVDEPTAPFNVVNVQGNGTLMQEARVRLDAELSRRVRRHANLRGASAATFFHLAWACVLARCTGKDDMVFGTVLFGRMQGSSDAQRALGMFINTLPVRIRMRGQSVEQCLAQTHATLAGLIHHEHASLALAQRCSALAGGTPLFSALLNYRFSSPAEGPMEWEGMQVLEEEERTNYPFTMSVDDLGDAFDLVAQTDGSVEARRMRDYLLAAVQSLVDALDVNPGTLLGGLNLLSAREQAELLAWSINERRYADNEPVHRVIEQQVQQTPQAPALVFGDVSLSYAELNRRANRLAHHLIAQGVKPEVRVAILVERSIEMVVGLLAILKAGGVYVPIDPEYPSERIAYMVQDSGVRLLLTQSHLRAQLPVGPEVLELDTLDLSGGQNEKNAHNPQVAVHGENLVYVIYTSGSTGRPKGAANRHRSLFNRLAWMQQAYPLSAADTVLQKTPFSFDVSVWEFFWPLMVGARLAVAGPGDHHDPARLVELIQRHRISTLHFVPSMLQAFLAHPGIEACRGLKQIICSGEALPAELQHQVFERLPQARLHNLYGPTEAAIDVTHWTCRKDGLNHVAIGRPIADTQARVLDAESNPVPQGVAGELCLGGIGLARGYLDRPGLTAERFVADPQGQGARLYRTGDLVRWRADGQLEYLGRIDHQVKLRGLRIELGEIEAQLMAQPEVREAVVVAKDARLIAYVSGVSGASQLDTETLRTQLGKQLPEYMVPAVFVQLEQLPLNANGKVDRKALPEPQHAMRAYEAPQGEIEVALAAIWADVLKLDRVGRHDNFFEIGGHSLSVMEVAALARERHGIELPLRAVFDAPTPLGLSRALASHGAKSAPNRSLQFAALDALLAELE
jgi:amino acid adenylation domain-containing protein